MVDNAVYAEKEERRAPQSKKLRPFAWAGLLANLVALALILNRLVTNISIVGARSESFIATTVTMLALLITIATTLGWARWLYRRGTADGLSVLWMTTIALIVLSTSAALTPEFYVVSPAG